jgi:tetratricopeptide (TPR) repeat protein
MSLSLSTVTAAHGSEAAYGEVRSLISRWEILPARAAVDALPGDEDPRRIRLEGMVNFYEGRYLEAVESYGRIPPEMAERMGVLPLLRLARETSRMAEFFTRRESAHFVLFLDDRRDWVLAEAALETLEKTYRAAGEWLGHFPREKIRVEIISQVDRLEGVTGLTRREIENSGAVGVCKFNKIMLLSPRLIPQGYRWRDVLAHEYIHYLVVRMTFNGAIVWLQEGLARHGEGLWRSSAGLTLRPVEETLLARAIQGEALVPLRKMDHSLVHLSGPGEVQLAFAESAAAVDYLLRRWKVEGVRRLLEALSSAVGPSGRSAVFRDSIGMGLEEFEAGWLVHLREQDYREVPGLRVPVFNIASSGDTGEEWDLERWQPREARRHLKLGDMLRSRGRNRAGLREYVKAQEISPASPYVLNKVGKALAELGRAEEAETAFRRAIVLHPDYPASYVNLARLLAEGKEWKAAAALLKASLDINPFNPFAWKDLAMALAELGDGEAWRSAETAFRLNPGDRELRNLLGK